MDNQFVTLVRHAKSSWKNQNQSDYDRPLNHRGVQNGPVMARRLARRQCIPELIMCSAARRAQETAAFLYDEFELSPEQFQLHEELYLASPHTLLDALSKVPVSVNHVMVIAHNPGLEALSELLSGQSLPPMPTLGVRHFSCVSIRDLKSHCERLSDTHEANRRAPATLEFDDYPKAHIRDAGVADQ